MKSFSVMFKPLALPQPFAEVPLLRALLTPAESGCISGDDAACGHVGCSGPAAGFPAPLLRLFGNLQQRGSKM